MQHVLAFPSPAQGVWHLGPFPLRAYALMIILGIVVAVWLGERRWAARGGTPGVVIDIAVWAVPFGLIGGRLYHVITDNQMYFGADRDPIDALKVWNGGLGIWGAVALGALGAYFGCRRRGINLRPFADAVAPGIALAQGIGRWGNWFNQELYGRPTTLPWALTIDQEHRPRLPDGSLDPHYADVATYHPTFLYESLWCFGVAILVIWAGRRFKLNYGRSFALYVAAYTVGRAWIEWLRIDNAHHFLGLRLNDYTALVVFLGAVAYLYVYRGKGDVEEVLERQPVDDKQGLGDKQPLDDNQPVNDKHVNNQPVNNQPVNDKHVNDKQPLNETNGGEPVDEADQPAVVPAARPEHDEPPAQAAARRETPCEEPSALAEPAMEEPVEPVVVPVAPEDHDEPVEQTATGPEAHPKAHSQAHPEAHDEPVEPAVLPTDHEEQGREQGREQGKEQGKETAATDDGQAPVAKRWWEVAESKESP